MSRRNDIQKLWEELNNEVKNQIYGICKRIVPNSSPFRIYVGSNANKKTNLFIIEFPIEDTSLFDQINDSKGLQISVEPFGDEQKGCNSCRISSADIKVNDIFCAFAEDVILIAERVTRKSKFTTTIIERLKLWKTFFETNKGQGLSKTEQVGLYGELYVLENLISNKDISIIQYWKGPTHSAQDFQFVDAAIEVKSTVNEYKKMVHISNAKQLDLENRKYLFLVFNQYEVFQSNGDTLPDIIKRIKSKVTDTEWYSAFETRLLEQGYFEADDNKYKMGYVTRKQLIYHVTTTFPKLTYSSLPHGICDVSYDLDLEECNNYLSDYAFLYSRIR